jgi:hypothetical protein
LLFLNGTSEKTGRRVITSPLTIDTMQFPDAIDFFGRVKREINLSTAVHNSARFPYIDAAGNIWLTQNGGSVEVDRITDGGYFENFGAATAFDLLQSLKQLDPDHRKFFPVVVQISSDPSLTDADTRNLEWDRKLGFWMDVASDTTVPVVTFYDTRDALGYRATEIVNRSLILDRAAPEGSQRYFHFRLTDPHTPMSWAMSSFAISAINREWETTPVDRKELADFGRLLWPELPPMGLPKRSSGCEAVL